MVWDRIPTRPNVTCYRSRRAAHGLISGLQHFWDDYNPFEGWKWVCPNLLALSLQHLKANEGKGIKLGKVMETNETDKVVDIFACIFSGLTCGTWLNRWWPWEGKLTTSRKLIFHKKSHPNMTHHGRILSMGWAWGIWKSSHCKGVGIMQWD